MGMIRCVYRGLLGGSIAMVCLIGTVEAQNPADTTKGDENIVQRKVDISGQAGVYGELYGISGRSARRPSATGRLFIRPSITIWDELTFNFNILLSNEGVSTRQSINQIGLDPSWSWGDAHIGDFSESFSRYTLEGVTIRGGGVNLYPGILRFSTVVGKTQRAVSGGAGNKSYTRTIYGAKLGIGKESGSFIDLIFVRAKDDVGSLPPDSTLTNPGAIYADTTDTTMVGNAPPVNPYAISPQENLVGAVSWQWNVLPNTLVWKSEVSGSFFTRDLRSARIDYSDLNAPSFAKNLYTPRYSSNADVVMDSKLNLNLSRFSTNLGYKWIGPGYRSLGTSYLINDQQEFSSRLSYRFSTASISLNWARINDNLLKQKRFKTIQRRYGGTVNTRFTDFWTNSFSVNIVTRGDNSDNDTTSSSFNNLTINTSQNISFSEHPFFQSLSVNYSYQKSETETGVQFKNINTTHTLNTSLSIQLMENISSNTSYGLVLSKPSERERIVTNTINAGLRHHAFENKWNNSLSFSSSFRSDNISYRTRLTSSYRLTKKDQISLNLSMMNFRRNSGAGNNFSEFTGSLRITHQF